METAAYLYPWDIVGDPAAPDVIAALGLDHVVLAAHYHAARAMTPRHPRHRIVVAHQTTAHYRSADGFGAALTALGEAGVRVHAWAVVNHVDLPAAGSHHVRNAFGDIYPWALCPANPAVREYAQDIASDVAGLTGIDGVELESCGWYGFDHLSAHDKTGAIPVRNAVQFLLSLCFCASCHDATDRAGIDPVSLRQRVRAAIDAALVEDVVAGTSEWDQVRAVLADADEVLALRRSIADDYRAAIVGRIRATAPALTVALHANPQPHRSLSFTGVDPTVASATVDALVVDCWHDLDSLPAAVAGGGPVHASLLAVRRLGGRGDLIRQAVAARDAGARGVRLYHAGLASATDLGAITDLTRHFREEA